MACDLVELLRQNQKAGAMLFTMKAITLTMKCRQALVFYAQDTIPSKISEAITDAMRLSKAAFDDRFWQDF